MAGRFKRQDKQKKSVVRPSYACAHEQRIHNASVIAAKKLFSIYPHILSKKMNTYYLPKGLNSSRHPKRAMLKGFFLRTLMSLRENPHANSLLIPEKIVNLIPSEHQLVTNPIRLVAHLKITLMKLN